MTLFLPNQWDHLLTILSSFSVPDRTRAFCMFDVAKTRDLTSKSMTLKLYHVTNIFLFCSYSYFSIEDLERMISCGNRKCCRFIRFQRRKLCHLLSRQAVCRFSTHCQPTCAAPFSNRNFKYLPYNFRISCLYPRNISQIDNLCAT